MICASEFERTFSKLKIDNNCLQSNMGYKRLNSLIPLNVKHGMLKSFNFDKIYDIFCKYTML